MKTAFVFGDTFRFAVFVNDSYQATRHYNITLYPEILVYRNKDLLPIHLRQMDKAPIQLAEYTQPVLFPIDGFTIPRFCRKFCYVRCGFPSKFEAQKLIDTNFTLGFVEVNSDFANATQMKEGDWVGFLPEHGVFVKLNQRLDDKSTLKYFEEDSKAKKVTPERLPPEFRFIVTTDAFAREFNRWWLHIKETIAPATPYLLVTVLILALNIIYGRVKKANVTNKANAMMAAKKRD